MTAADCDPAPPADLRGIQQVASELGITQRTIRFYEDKGLIEPQRAGTMRVYTRREFARMQVILRGKRLGFSLRDIKAFLDLYDADPDHAEQTHLLAERVADRIATLEDQQRALTQTLDELRLIERQARERISQIEG